jgi:hypothetical protein
MDCSLSLPHTHRIIHTRNSKRKANIPSIKKWRKRRKKKKCSNMFSAREALKKAHHFIKDIEYFMFYEGVTLFRMVGE